MAIGHPPFVGNPIQLLGHFRVEFQGRRAREAPHAISMSENLGQLLPLIGDRVESSMLFLSLLFLSRVEVSLHRLSALLLHRRLHVVYFLLKKLLKALCRLR